MTNIFPEHDSMVIHIHTSMLSSPITFVELITLEKAVSAKWTRRIKKNLIVNTLNRKIYLRGYQSGCSRIPSQEYTYTREITERII